MDIDRFIADNQAVWDRLDRLTQRADRSVQRLSAEELAELVRLYRRASGHLATAQSRFADPALTAHLTRLVSRASAVVHGTRPQTLRALLRFLSETFPAAVWHARRPVVLSAGLFVAAALAVGIWIANSPAAYEATMPAPVRDAYLAEDFAGYYRAQPAAQFASWVFVNNVRVAILAFAGGIAFCLPTAAVLLLNGAHVGMAAGLFTAAGLAPRFWGLVLPHGLLELAAVFVAGGAGLRLGWSIIDPGDRPRRQALAEEARRAVAVLVGLVAAFLVAGLLEAFVTPSSLPTSVRVGSGAAVTSAFVAYVVVQGRLAAARGRSGMLGEVDPGWADTHAASRAGG